MFTFHPFPTLPTNPIIASFTIIAWLLFKPSSWCSYVTYINPTLTPDFALADLTFSQWQQPKLYRLVLLGQGLWAVWVSIFISVFLWLLHYPIESILLATCYAFLLSFMGGLLASLTISVAFGIIVSSLGAILLSVPVGIEGDILFSMAENIAIIVMFSVSDSPVEVLGSGDLPTLLTVLLGIFVSSLAGNIMYRTTTTKYSSVPYQHVGSIMIGVLVSCIAVFLITGITSMLIRTAATLMDNATWFSFVFDGLVSSVFGLAFLLIWGLRTSRWLQSIWIGLVCGILLACFTWLMNTFHQSEIFDLLFNGLHGGVENALLYTSLFSFPFVLAKRIATAWAGVIAGIFGSAGVYLTFMIFMERYSIFPIISWMILAFMAGMTVQWWRPILFYPFVSAWNLLLYRADEKRVDSQSSLITWHTAFWDEYQYLPLYGLEHYLVMVVERHPAEGKFALDHLTGSAQNWAVQEAQIELDARRLQGCQDVKTISSIYRQLIAAELNGAASAVLRSFSRFSRDVETALAQESIYNQRLALDAIEERLDHLLRELNRTQSSYALRFHPIAAQWRQVLADHAREISEAVESRQEINNPYVIGIPLTEHQEIFVGRSDVSERIERLLLDRRRPPLLLYGQRRTGKTSLLNNLGRLLPSTIIPLFVDLQGPASLAKDYEGFLYNIGRAMITSAKRHRELMFPPLTRALLQADPFTAFDEWLDAVEQCLTTEQTLLLSLDEFSALDHALDKGNLDEASVLGMFRHIIQHRPRFKLLLSGSHTLDEFERWASYLINVQTVHLSYLQAEEALQLIEQPVKNFELRYTYEATQRIMEVTRCHPALIQLVCAEMVSLKNKQNIVERRLAQVEDVEAAIPGALQHGRFFFADIANNQVNEQDLKILRYLAAQGENAIMSLDALSQACQLSTTECETTLTNLLRRELVEPLGGGYRFQIELARRWFLN